MPAIDLSNPDLFDGETIDGKIDTPRLHTQIERTYDLMRDRQWRTLEQIVEIIGGSEAGISARLRDLRKPWWGGHTVDARRVDEIGLWAYRLHPALCGLLDGKRASNPKQEAREAITAFLDARVVSRNLDPDIITGFNGHMLLVSDLRELLR